MDNVLSPKKAKPPLRPGSIPKTFIRGEALSKKTQARTKSGKDSLQIAHPDADWFDTRLDMIGLNRHLLSIEFDPGAKNWLNKILSGERRCQIAEVSWLAQRLRVSGADIIRALGYVLPSAEVPIVGTVAEDSRVDFFPAGAKLDRTTAPPGAEVHTVALSCRFNKGPLRFLNAQILFFSPLERTVQLGAVGRLAVFETKGEARKYIGTTDRAGLGGAVDVSLLTGETVQLQHLTAATPVEWTKTI